MSQIPEPADPGLHFLQAGNLDEAERVYRRAIQAEPARASLYANLGVALFRLRRLDEAAEAVQQALRLNPDAWSVHNFLGNIFAARGMWEEAAAGYRRALQLKPDFARAYNNLGLVLLNDRRIEEAVANFRKAVKLKPHFVAAHNNLGDALRSQGLLDEAMEEYRRTLRLRPDFAWGHAKMGNIHKDRGDLPAATARYRRAVQLDPNDAGLHSNLIHLLSFSPESDPASIREELRRWNQQHAAPLARLIEPYDNDCSPERPLRIGYVSPDFRLHPVGRFIYPLLHAHDRKCFEIFCYSSAERRDTLGERCRALAEVWRDVYALSDDELAAVIRQDRIDILVDLAMHTANNRLLVFARKPAPVQVAYLAYCGSTGLTTMDYRLTDPYLDPSAQDDCDYTEESIRLPRTYWCYVPLIEPPAAPPPTREAGAVVFACLNNFCKVTPPTLEAWRRLLQALPTAELLVHAHPGSHRDRVHGYFAEGNVAPQRLTFVPRLPWPEYFRTYERVDIALDPFPCGGGTTTCDALWMGVPVVSLRGRTAVGRIGSSILSNIGLAELVADDIEEYVRKAAGLARDIPRLRALRSSLPERMRNSPLMNAPAFAQDVESAYRAMWRRWCASRARGQSAC